MKTLTLYLLSAAALAFTGCKHCNCDNANTGTTADREMNKDGTDGSGSTTVNVDSEAASTRYSGGTPKPKQIDAAPRNGRTLTVERSLPPESECSSCSSPSPRAGHPGSRPH